MEELFIETDRGKIPIDPKIIEKYQLEKGMTSPFSRGRIVNAKGEFPEETSVERDPRNSGGKSKEEKAENITFSTSEIIDLAHGEDSKTET